MSERQRRMHDVLLFLVRFFLLSVVLHFLIWLNLDMSRIQMIIADSIYFILTIFKISIPKAGNIFMLSDSSGKILAEITRDCVAWKSILAYICLIFATEVKIKSTQKKISAMIAGSAIIFFANIVRLATTFAVVQAYGIKYFDVVHNVLWQGGMVILIIVLWDLMRRKCL